MNRSEIRNLVVENTRRTDKTSLINSAINIAVAELSSQRTWSDLQLEADLTTTASVASVDLPSDYHRLVEGRLVVAGSNFLSRQIQIYPKTWVVKHYPNPENIAVGKPVLGYLEGTKLFLVPYPDDAYTLKITYFRLHPALATDSDTVLIRHGSQAVVAYATAWTFRAIEKHQDAAEWMQTYAQLLATAKEVDTSNSAVQRVAEPRGAAVPLVQEYWLDPFTKHMP